MEHSQQHEDDGASPELPRPDEFRIRHIPAVLALPDAEPKMCRAVVEINDV